MSTQQMTAEQRADFYRDAYQATFERAEALEKSSTRLYEREALHTEESGMQRAEIDRLTALVVLLAELLGRFHEFQFDAGGYCEWCGCTTNWKHNDDCVYPEVTAALAAAKGEKHE